MTRKTIFITGAGSGIGRATARLFAERGWFVGLYDINEAAVQAVAGEMAGDHCCHGHLDVTDPHSFEQAVEHFSGQTNGRMDVLFSSAGIMFMGCLDQVSLDEQLRTVRVNFDGVIIGIYAALPLLKATPGATILTMSSSSAFYGVPNLAVYSATKFGVRGLTEALNIELERFDIHVTDIMPLYVNTTLVTDQRHRPASLNRLGKHLEPEAIAEVAFKAVQGRKVHWLPSLKLKCLALLGRFLPWAEKPLMKRISRD